MGNKMNKLNVPIIQWIKLQQKETIANKTMIVDQKLLSEACENISKLE